jgi:hypothetical protein
MENDEEAEKAIQELNGATVEGRTIVVNKSEPKPEGERRTFNNNRSGGGGYNGGGGGAIYAGGGGGGSYLISTATLISSVTGGNTNADGAAVLTLVAPATVPVPVNTIPNNININNYNFYNKILSGSVIFNSIAGDYCTANLINGSAYYGGINTLISTPALVSLCNPIFKSNGLISNGVQILPEITLNPIVINQFINPGASSLHYNYVAGLSYGGIVNLANNIAITPYLTNVVVVNSFNNCSANVNMSAFEGIVITGSGVNVVGLTTKNNLIAGGNASYTFGDGNQIMCLTGGGAIINGNNSINTIIIQGESHFPMAVNTNVNGAYSTTKILTSQGVSTLINCDYLQYDNTTIAISVGAGQAAGQAYRLYQAVFDRAPDKAGISYWIKQLENGISLESIASGFIKSAEFVKSYGANVSNTNLINACYQNVLDRPADAQGLAYWVARLSNGTSVAQVLAEFSESVENIQNVASLIGQGIEVQMA